MAPSRALLSLLLLAMGCGGKGPSAGPPTVPPSPEARVSPVPASPLLAEGLKLSLQPFLHGVSSDDLPETARREVEILAFEKGQLRLRWTGIVRVEKPESSRRREDWVRTRANAPRKATPEPLVAPEYENRSVTGTLYFPDFAKASQFLLPGLWPEGNATLPGASAMWIPAAALAELRDTGRTHVPFYVSSRLLKEPASGLMQRASSMARSDGRLATPDRGDPPERWRDVPSERSYPLRLDGADARAPMLRARNWFGAYEILDDEKNPLVLSVLPDPPSGLLLDLFAPANVLKTLLGYRVAAIESPKEKQAK
jgi:hypothetical protein